MGENFITARVNCKAGLDMSDASQDEQWRFGQWDEPELNPDQLPSHLTALPSSPASQRDSTLSLGHGSHMATGSSLPSSDPPVPVRGAIRRSEGEAINSRSAKWIGLAIGLVLLGVDRLDRLARRDKAHTRP